MHIFLRDVNSAVCAAWRLAFANAEGVTVEEGDIFSTPVDAVVSPANSFGWMDGGIDLVYRNRMGMEIEQRVKAAIGARRPFGELLVGDALDVTTMWEPCPWLIVAPTMRTPRGITAENVYLSTRAALACARTLERNYGVKTVAMPGMGTLTGRVPPDQAADAMYSAWQFVKYGKVA